jgi:hypothetical protein
MGGKRVLALVVLAVFACARPADAGWLDIIWEMTGPQMIGVGAGCEVSLARNGDWRCTVPFKRLPNRLGTADQKDDRWWLSAYTYYYWSTAHKDYDGFAVQGLGVDPMVSFAHYRSRVRITHGVGFTLQRFWSDDFATVGNAGLKIQPVTAEFRLGGTVKLELAYNLRVYWDGFESRPSIPPVLTKTSESERTHGVVVSLTF